MYYIKSQPNEFGNYGNPTSVGEIALPDHLLNDYIATKGFAFITIEENAVTAVEVNQDALDAYLAGLEPEKDEPTEQDDINAMLIDHEMRLIMLELGVE